MYREELEILSNRQVNAAVWEMKLGGGGHAHRPGQFVNIAIDGLYLRRPISVCDWSDGVLTLLYKVVGKGTGRMTAMLPGQRLDVLTCLGNGFDLGDASAGKDASAASVSRRPLLVGGGIGTAPLYFLAKELIAAGKQVSVILGFNQADEIICRDELEALGAHVIIATADGSVGVRGFVTDALSQVDYDFFYACGPMPMLRAMNGRMVSKGQVSLEERMGCGTGICMGCTCRTLVGAKRICKDGPVFNMEEISW